MADEPVSVWTGSAHWLMSQCLYALGLGAVSVSTGSGHWLVGLCLFGPGQVIGSWGCVCLDRVRSLADGAVAVWTGSGHWLVGPCLFEPGSDRWLVQTLRVDSLFHVCID